MDLRDDIPTQLTDLTDVLRQLAAHEAPPAPAVWAEMRQVLADRALFIESFVTERISTPVSHLALEPFATPEPETRELEVVPATSEDAEEPSLMAAGAF